MSLTGDVYWCLICLNPPEVYQCFIYLIEENCFQLFGGHEGLKAVLQIVIMPT